MWRLRQARLEAEVDKHQRSIAEHQTAKEEASRTVRRRRTSRPGPAPSCETRGKGAASSFALADVIYVQAARARQHVRRTRGRRAGGQAARRRGGAGSGQGADGGSHWGDGDEPGVKAAWSPLRRVLAGARSPGRVLRSESRLPWVVAGTRDLARRTGASAAVEWTERAQLRDAGTAPRAGVCTGAATHRERCGRGGDLVPGPWPWRLASWGWMCGEAWPLSARRLIGAPRMAGLETHGLNVRLSCAFSLQAALDRARCRSAPRQRTR